MASVDAKVLSVNVGKPKQFDYKGRQAKSAIWKSPVSGKIVAQGVNLEGDDQADRAAHGGIDKAVYAYAHEDVMWWEQQTGLSLEPGAFGENLTTQGIAVNDALIGERWQIGTTILEVSEPRIPCWRLGVRMQDNTFPKKFTQALRPGPYFRIVQAGELAAGSAITVIDKPNHDLTLRDVFRIYTKDHQEADRILQVTQMSADWHRWANDTVQKNQ